MPNANSRITVSDSLVLFVDLQEGIVELSRTTSLQRLKTGVLGLAKLAKLYDMPTIVSGVRDESGQPPAIISQIGEAIGSYPIYERTTADSFINEAVLAAAEATRRRTLLISGVSSEVAVQLAALTAADLGYRVFLVVDACGGMSERTEQAAFDRIGKAGGALVSVMTLAGELCGDFRGDKAQTAIGILYEMAKA